jgi:hypothetical protein
MRCVVGNSDVYRAFLSQEVHVLESETILEMTKFFPEFLNVTPDPPSSNLCRIPVVPIDPGTIHDNFTETIQTFKLFTRRYKSLVGFPFWEIIPYWLRVSEAWATDKKDPEHDDAGLVAERISPEVMRVLNSTGQSGTFRVRYISSHKWPPQSMMMLDSTADFSNATFVPSRQMSKTLDVEPGQSMYLSLLDVPGGWTSARIELSHLKRFAPSPPEDVDLSLVHDQFIADMREFAITWSEVDTEELVMLIPRYAFREPDFASVEGIAKSSNLCQRYATSVVLLRALILHQFNYIRWTRFGAVNKTLWDSMTCFVSSADAADMVSNEIVIGPSDSFAVFTIDRHAAQQLVVAGRGDPSKSIVSQMTASFRKVGLSHLQCKKRPWKVKFVGEHAIDAGGPTRELMTEAAASIFEPTSRLVIASPNNRRQTGQFRDTFIPFERRNEELRTVGHYLGIVLRTGFAQDLPFAPLVWRFLAGEALRCDDVTAVDDGLREHFRHLQEESGAPDFEQRIMAPWAVEGWDGAIQPLPGHTVGSFVRASEVEFYVHESIQFRILQIRPALKIVRKAFRENVGFKRHPLLTGSLLARMAQGSGVVTAGQLKAITIYTDYDGPTDPYIARFWRAVDRLNSEQMKLLMKFVTTFTRLPNPTINPEFRIHVDKMAHRAPDQSLPTASTCFNRLHLPMYTDDEICYQKLLYAIQFCQTMENK